MDRVLYCLSSHRGVTFLVPVCLLKSRPGPLGPIHVRRVLLTFVDADIYHGGVTTPQRSDTGSVFLADQYLDGNVQDLRRTLGKS